MLLAFLFVGGGGVFADWEMSQRAWFRNKVVMDHEVEISDIVLFNLRAKDYLRINADTNAMTHTNGALDINAKTGVNSSGAIFIDLEAEDTFLPVYGIKVDIDDDATGGQETIYGLYVENSAGTASVTKGVSVANTVDDAFEATVGAAFQALVVDATTAANTGTAGVLDINYRTATTTGHAINLDVESDVAGGASEIVSGIKIVLDDDANTSTDELRAIEIRSDGNATGLQHGIVVDDAGLDAALYAHNGYVRIGTGSTPGITPGDDDLFVEGTVEVDGAAQFDSTVALNGNTTATLGAAEYMKLDGDTTAQTGTAGLLDIDIKTGATNTKGIYIDLEAEDTFANAYGVYVDVDDDASGGQETVSAFYAANSAGTASTTRGLDIANTIDDGVVATVGAAAQALVVDAATTDNTGTTGAIDVEYDSITNGAEAMNIKATAVAGGSGGEVVSGIVLDVDDDTDAAGTVIGMDVQASDATGSSTVIGIRLGNALEDQISATVGAGNQAAVIDASTTANTGTTGAIDIGYQSITNGAEAVNIYVQAGDSGSSFDVAGIVLDLDDDDATAGGTTNLYGINIAASDVTGNAAVTGIYLANSLETGVNAVAGAANKVLVVDAETAAHTQTAGVIDAGFSTITNGASFLNIDMVTGDAGAGVTAHAALIDLDDDTSSNSANIHGVSVTSSDLTGHVSTIVRAFYASGVDAAFQADNGYVRIGTGATPDVTPGDDDLFVEGTAEIDGITYADGGVGFAQGASIIHHATVELTNADIKALRGTKKELVAAPAAGSFLELVSAVLILDYGSEALTESDDDLVIQYGTSGDDATAVMEMTGFIDQTADMIETVLGVAITANAASDMVANSLELFNDGDGEFGGNASNDTTMTVKVAYRIHTAGL
jgi:hypothetical protein